MIPQEWIDLAVGFGTSREFWISVSTLLATMLVRYVGVPALSATWRGVRYATTPRKSDLLVHLLSALDDRAATLDTRIGDTREYKSLNLERCCFMWHPEKRAYETDELFFVGVKDANHKTSNRLSALTPWERKQLKKKLFAVAKQVAHRDWLNDRRNALIDITRDANRDLSEAWGAALKDNGVSVSWVPANDKKA